MNLLVTGPPRSGKTTVAERTVDRLTDAGIAVGGLFSPEVREDGERVGFDLVAVARDRRAPLARVDRTEGPSVGKYCVDIDAVEEFARTVLGQADAYDVVVVDEIAPMQVRSEAFVRQTGRLLDAPRPVLAAVKQDTADGFAEQVKRRPDVDLFEVSVETRDALPATLAARLRRAVV